MGPYQIKQIFSNGTMLLESVDGHDAKFPANGYRLRPYKRLVNREHFMQMLKTQPKLQVLDQS